MNRTVLITFIFLFQYLVSAFDASAQEKNPDIIRNMAIDEYFGLILFYRTGCGSCNEQYPVFQDFVRFNQWKPFKTIDVQDNPWAAVKFEVETVPEIWLVTEDGKIIRISSGFAPPDLIRNNILSAYYRAYA
ncbi:putative conjugative transfer signal peptidase TraF [Desulfonema limicola]|uniref:Conjugative transfer signal peptidase TraF n=1 Tax=Desulfonema limicola TaxID=45656 RepID=A0A975GER6_9BACT|nr:conjugal transfer protein TraF [Desulfonema limicola]QTA78507.1 putative conjugative transfer signal peptidase TraF [Desulfonema limicola]